MSEPGSLGAATVQPSVVALALPGSHGLENRERCTLASEPGTRAQWLQTPLGATRKTEPRSAPLIRSAAPTRTRSRITCRRRESDFGSRNPAVYALAVSFQRLRAAAIPPARLRSGVRCSAALAIPALRASRARAAARRTARSRSADKRPNAASTVSRSGWLNPSRKLPLDITPAPALLDINLSG